MAFACLLGEKLPNKASYVSRIIIVINLSGGLKSPLDAEHRLVECVIHPGEAWGGLVPHIWEATCCTTTARGRGTTSKFEAKTERSEVVESLTRAARASGDGRTRFWGCLTFHGEQKATQLAAWVMLAWAKSSYLNMLIF